jgi:hypothetical protein
MLDEATLAAHLERLGWEAQPHGHRTLRSVHPTEEGDVVVYIRRTDNWLIASVVPFLHTAGDNSVELARWLLRMNRDMFQTKFAYDEDGDVVLTVELPTESLDYSEIQSALESLRRYAILHRATLRQAALQPPE